MTGWNADGNFTFSNRRMQINKPNKFQKSFLMNNLLIIKSDIIKYKFVLEPI